jgi:hypothetical protein
MKKRFNVTGVCFPTEHYMADSSAKYARILAMVEQGDYFTINRPRQYGKTTALFQMEHILKQSKQYLGIRISFEGLGDSAFHDEEHFCQMFSDGLVYKASRGTDKDLINALEKSLPNAISFRSLSRYLTQMVETVGKKIVLMIDEVDKSSNNQLFLSFLGMLRDKYLERRQQATFHSVILTGVHDVKNLKLKLRPGEEQKYNSPWNIAADFEVDMNFQSLEIQPMLEEYAQDRAVAIDAQAVAERLFYWV